MSKIMSLYRVSNRLYKAKIPLLPGIISKIIRIAYSAEIPPSCTLEKGVELAHGGLGVVIHHNTTIGKNSKIYQNVTIGGREGRGNPRIGNNVYIGTGASILGGITIGDNAKIGANAVVLNDIPKDAVAVGIPAKVIKINK